MTLRELVVERIRTDGPLTIAEFMDLALYHPTLGYYTRASRRTGRTGDFFTSVDVGPQFGALLAAQLDEMFRLQGAAATDRFDIVEVGAGNGQLARDILDAAESAFPEMYASIRLVLVETSAAARAAHPDMLGHHLPRLADSADTLPDRVSGVILANEFLDALPTHGVAMTRSGLCEVFIDLDDGRFIERAGTPSTPELASYLTHLEVTLSPGWRGEVNLAAMDWVRHAARCLSRGFMMLIDYGHAADELYSDTHGAGTLTTFRRHLVDTTEHDPDQPNGPAWLAHPGEQDITSHVDWTSVLDTAETEGLELLGFPDQSRFLLGLGALDDSPTGSDRRSVKRRLALKTLLVPGGLGSTHRVLLLGKEVGSPALRGASFQTRTRAQPRLDHPA